MRLDTRRAAVLLAAALLAVTARAQAPDLAWERLPGPYGGYAAGVASLSDASGFVAVATTPDELYRSTDGAHWTPVDVAREPFAGLFAAPDGAFWALGAPLLRSGDRGLTWTEAGSGLPPGGALQLTAGPDGALYAAIPGGLMPGGLFRLAPGATLWTATGLVGSVLDVAVAPGGVLVAGLNAGQDYAGFAVHRSADGGATWTPVTLPSQTYSAVAALIVLPGGDLLAGGVALQEAPAAPRLFHSSDGGLTWTAGVVLPGFSTLTLFQAKGALFANTYSPSTLRSIDGGRTWEPTGSFYGDVAEGPGESILGTSDRLGIARSDDRGQTFVDATDGFGRAEVSHVETGPGGTVVVASRWHNDDADVYRSSDRGATWTRVRLSFAPRNLQDLHRDPTGRLFAAPDAYCYVDCEHTAGVYRSLDGGATWGPIPLASPVWWADHLIDGPDGALWVTHRYHASRSQPRLSRSFDGGTTWEERGPIPFDVSFAVGPDGTLWAGSGGLSLRVAKSTDDGASWTVVFDTPVGQRTGALAVADDGTVLVSGENVVHRSTDQGQTWQAVHLGLGPPAPQFDVFVANRDGVLFGGADGRSPVLRSSDGGLTWTTAAGLPEALYYTDLALDEEGFLWATLGDNGLSRTVSSTIVADAPIPATAVALSVAAAPNPANAAATVAVTLSQPTEDLTVAVFDVLGRQVAVLHAGPAPAGALRFGLDTEALSPGAYVVRASAGENVVARRLVVVR